MELKNTQQKIYNLALDKKNTGFCVHDVMEAFGMKAVDSSARINELLNKGLITKMFVKYTCRSSDRRHTFYGIGKELEEKKEEKPEEKIEKKPEEIKEKPKKMKTAAKVSKEAVNLKRAIGQLKARYIKLAKEVEGFKAKAAYSEDENQKLRDTIVELRVKISFIKELLREEMLGK